MQRWLYNVRAVMLHRDRATEDIQWWAPKPPPRGDDERPILRGDDERPPPRGDDERPPPPPIVITNIKIGRFTGQGRTTEYAGLSHAVMADIHTTGHPIYPMHYAEFAQKVHDRLERRGRPLSWFVTALLSEAVVITEVMLAFMLVFYTPTVGLGCWSGSFGLYAILSSLCWILSCCFRKPGRIVTGLCYTLNTLALGWLITATVLLVRDCSPSRLLCPASSFKLWEI